MTEIRVSRLVLLVLIANALVWVLAGIVSGLWKATLLVTGLVAVFAALLIRYLEKEKLRLMAIAVSRMITYEGTTEAKEAG